MGDFKSINLSVCLICFIINHFQLGGSVILKVLKPGHQGVLIKYIY